MLPFLFSMYVHLKAWVRMTDLLIAAAKAKQGDSLLGQLAGGIAKNFEGSMANQDCKTLGHGVVPLLRPFPFGMFFTRGKNADGPTWAWAG